MKIYIAGNPPQCLFFFFVLCGKKENRVGERKSLTTCCFSNIQVEGICCCCPGACRRVVHTNTLYHYFHGDKIHKKISGKRYFQIIFQGQIAHLVSFDTIKLSTVR